jgi:hypothetical protein
MAPANAIDGLRAWMSIVLLLAAGLLPPIEFFLSRYA